MRRPNLTCEFIQAVNILTGGVVQDRAPTMCKIVGYMLILRGDTDAEGQAWVPDLAADFGQIILRSALFGDLLTEPHLAFMGERTIQKKGNTRFIAPVAPGDPFDITLFHDLDATGDYSHGNIYPVLPGDALEWVLPACTDDEVTEGTIEVHRIMADTGRCMYLPRWRTRGLNLEEIRWTLDGHTAEIMMTESDDTVPGRVCLFDAFSKRECFFPWLSSLAWTNAQFRYDADQATMFCWSRFSDMPVSIKNIYKTTQLYLECTGGVGDAQLSYCIFDEVPEEMRRVAEILSQDEVAVAERHAEEGGFSGGTIKELESASAPVHSMTPGFASPISPRKSAPIGPVGRKKRISIF